MSAVSYKPSDALTEADRARIEEVVHAVYSGDPSRSPEGDVRFLLDVIDRLSEEVTTFVVTLDERHTLSDGLTGLWHKAPARREEIKQLCLRLGGAVWIESDGDPDGAS